MKFFRSLVITLYLCLYLAVGGALIILALNIFSQEEITKYTLFAYTNANLKLIIGVIGVLFVLIGFLSARISFGKMKRDKTITFENPDGQVLVSLVAIEDYIKKIVKEMPQVKDLKPAVSAGKKGLHVVCKVSLFSDSNIPEVTENVQSVIKSRLLEMLGIEESIKIRMHVAKLIGKAVKEDYMTENREKETSRHLPFKGMEK